MEPRRMDGGVEQSQTLVHAILGGGMEIWYHTGSLCGDGVEGRGGDLLEMRVFQRMILMTGLVQMEGPGRGREGGIVHGEEGGGDGGSGGGNVLVDEKASIEIKRLVTRRT